MIHVTIFPDLRARQANPTAMDFDELARRIEQPREYPAKAACPLLKLAKFGERTTDKGSLRQALLIFEWVKRHVG